MYYLLKNIYTLTCSDSRYKIESEIIFAFLDYIIYIYYYYYFFYIHNHTIIIYYFYDYFLYDYENCMIVVLCVLWNSFIVNIVFVFIMFLISSSFTVLSLLLFLLCFVIYFVSSFFDAWCCWNRKRTKRYLIVFIVREFVLFLLTPRILLIKS